MVGAILSAGFDINIDFEPGRKLDVKDFLVLLRESAQSPESMWSENYNDANSELKGVVTSYLENIDLLITYEAVPWFFECADQAGCNHIDIRLSSFRFLPDLMFGLRTNSEFIARYLESVHCDIRKLKVEAGLLKARQNHIWQDKSLVPTIEHDGLVFVGQTERDASLINERGEFEIVDNWVSVMRQKFEFYNACYYKRHPMASCGHADREKKILASVFSEVREVHCNIYSILCSDLVGKVFSISSGVMDEASVFGKDSFYFKAPVFKLNDTRRKMKDGYWNIPFTKFSRLEFWANLLEFSHDEVEQFKVIDMNSFEHSGLRFLHNESWGYDRFLIENNSFYRSLFDCREGGEVLRNVAENKRRIDLMAYAFKNPVKYLVGKVGEQLKK
jgi:hypothetical protein